MANVRRILIVDDDADLRDALVEQLAWQDGIEGFAVDTATKGVQAAKAGQIDLAIMDVGLPDIDGRDAVRILRKHGFKAPAESRRERLEPVRPGNRRWRLQAHRMILRRLRGASHAH